MRFKIDLSVYRSILSYFKINKKACYIMKILVMGLPGSGKTYLTERLVPLLNAAWYNADKVREMANDWDFSDVGRDRQSKKNEGFCRF